jgi:hypothetical protein
VGVPRVLAVDAITAVNLTAWRESAVVTLGVMAVVEEAPVTVRLRVTVDEQV